MILRIFKLCILGYIILLLAACAHTTKKDGPPNFYVDVSRIPNAVPKNERLSRYGNMPSYVVQGKRYYTMKSSKNYVKRGIASWYGTKFHKQKTSSGEPYDMLAMTAAHKTLPLPTYVEVTNLKNNRTIIVKVNDRGPFIGNRLIDLSYVAAKKLGVTVKGTAPVKIKAIDPNQFYESTGSWFLRKAKNLLTQDNAELGRFIQIGAFQAKSNATRLKDRLGSIIPAPITIMQIRNYYKVKIGPLHEENRIKNILATLNHYGIKHSLT